METIINVEKLTKAFKRIKKGSFLKNLFKPEFTKVEAVKSINFQIKKGESIAFLGPNGAGKTTTIKMLSGLIYPTSGSVTVIGFTPSERKKEFLTRIGLVMGNKAGLNWDLTGKQSFELIKEIYHMPTEKFLQRMDELTNLLDIAKFMDVQVRNLSLGERMKMELVGAILHDPEVLFLDEPTIGLDILAKQKIRSFLREIQSKYNVTMLLTSHDMDDIEQVCDRVIVINNGEKVYDDKLITLTEKYNKDRYIKFIFDKLPAINEFNEVEIFEKGSNFYVFKLKKDLMSKFVSEVTTKYNLADIEIISTPLEEIIADIFRKIPIK